MRSEAAEHDANEMVSALRRDTGKYEAQESGFVRQSAAPSMTRQCANTRLPTDLVATEAGGNLVIPPDSRSSNRCRL